MAPRKHLSASESAFLDDLRALLLSRSAGQPGVQGRPEDQLFSEFRRLARAMLLAPQTLTDIVGPVCATGQATAWLGVSRQALHKAVRENRVVALQSQDGKWFYPTWQFSRTGLGSDLVAQLLDTLRSGMSALEAAAWFVAASPALDGLTPVQWLESGKEPERLTQAAVRTVRPLRGGDSPAPAGRQVGHSAQIVTSAIDAVGQYWR